MRWLLSCGIAKYEHTRDKPAEPTGRLERFREVNLLLTTIGGAIIVIYVFPGDE
jgi:hypothetical protein